MGMPRFKIYLRGENFLLSLDGEHGKYGFHACRIVRAADCETAKRIAIILVHKELNRDTTILNQSPQDRFRLTVVRLEKLSVLNFARKKSCQGFDFFSEDS